MNSWRGMGSWILLYLFSLTAAQESSAQVAGTRRLKDRATRAEILEWTVEEEKRFGDSLCEKSTDRSKPADAKQVFLERHESNDKHGDICRSASSGGFFCPHTNDGDKSCRKSEGAPYCLMTASERPCRAPHAPEKWMKLRMEQRTKHAPEKKKKKKQDGVMHSLLGDKSAAPASSPAAAAASPHAGNPPQVVGVLNAGKECYAQCTAKSGACPGFCGSQGACCRKGEEGEAGEAACGHGVLGCGHHCCTAAAGSVAALEQESALEARKRRRQGMRSNALADHNEAAKGVVGKTLEKIVDKEEVRRKSGGSNARADARLARLRRIDGKQAAADAAASPAGSGASKRALGETQGAVEGGLRGGRRLLAFSGDTTTWPGGASGTSPSGGTATSLANARVAARNLADELAGQKMCQSETGEAKLERHGSTNPDHGDVCRYVDSGGFFCPNDVSCLSVGSAKPYCAATTNKGRLKTAKTAGGQAPAAAAPSRSGGGAKGGVYEACRAPGADSELVELMAGMMAGQGMDASRAHRMAEVSLARKKRTKKDKSKRGGKKGDKEGGDREVASQEEAGTAAAGVGGDSGLAARERIAEARRKRAAMRESVMADKPVDLKKGVGKVLEKIVDNEEAAVDQKEAAKQARAARLAARQKRMPTKPKDPPGRP